MRRCSQNQLNKRETRLERLENRLLLTKLVDLDADGDLDAFFRSAWYENFDGQGNFISHEFGTGGIANSVLADLNGDNKLEIVTSEPRWYENNGLPENFVVDHPLEGGQETRQIKVIDLHGDGDDDIVLMSESQIALFENTDGLGTMQLRFSDAVADVTDAADIDLDGDMDFLILRELPDLRRQTILLTNQGDDSFEETIIFEDRTIGQIFLPFWDRETEGGEFRDMDGDGFNDVIHSHYNQHGNERRYTWFRNRQGNGEFDAARPMPFGQYVTRNIYSDIDHDGDLDIFYWDYWHQGNQWALNDGQGDFTETGLTTFPGSFSPSVTDIGDINGDGVFDYITSSIVDGVPQWADGVTDMIHVNQAPPDPLRAGDANQDYFFDEADLIQVAKHGMFEKENATWEQGDWNGAPGGAPFQPPMGDGRFESSDLVAALDSRKYRNGAYGHAAMEAYSETRPMRLGLGDADIVVRYDGSSGELNITNNGGPLTAFHLRSASDAFHVDAVSGFDGPFDVVSSDSIFRFDLNGIEQVDVGPLLSRNLPWQTVFYDLEIDGARLEGGGLGDVQLTCSDCNLDVESFYDAIRSNRWSTQRDLNRDAILDAQDLRFLLHEVLGSSVGDSNLDGKFDSADIVHVFKSGHYDDGSVENSRWTQGDWNVDGEFDSRDLVWAFQFGDFESRGQDNPPQTIGEVTFDQKTLKQTAFVGTAINADLDSDGDADLVTIGSNMVAWYEQIGNGVFTEPKIISLSTGSGIAGTVFDLDGDEDLDIVVASYSNFDQTENETVWFENLDGEATFGEKQQIDDSGDWSLASADLDGDGDSDLIRSGTRRSPMQWFENIGDGTNLIPRQTFGSRGTQSREIVPLDFDGDGDLDLLLGRDLSGVLWENIDGAGNFLEKAVLAGNPTLLTAGDVDNDGDTDIVARFFPSGFSVYSNIDGDGTFELNEQSTNLRDLWNLAIVDMDGDGDNDVITARRPTRGIEGEGIFWSENNGDGTFDRTHLIHSGVADFLGAEDIDSDGDWDVLVSAEGTFKWLENRDGRGTFGIESVIDIFLSRSLNYTDIDRDGDVDVLVHPFSRLKNRFGENEFSIDTVPGAERYYLYRNKLLDIDADDDLDFLVFSEFGLAWHENAYGEGIFGAKRIIDTEGFPLWISGGDLDNDGDQDVVTMTRSSLQWYRNIDGNGRFTRAIPILLEDSESLSTARLSDLDGDNDLDILISNGQGASWIENVDGVFHEPMELAAGGYQEIITVDSDRDGDLDVLLTSSTATYVIENLDGVASFEDRQMISNQRDLAMLSIADFDLDGDQDLIAFSRVDREILWFENINGVASYDEHVIAKTDAEVFDLASVDLDGDGDVDVVARFVGNGKIAWYDNQAIDGEAGP